MAWLFVQYLAINKGENLPKNIKICQKGSKICQILKKPIMFAKRLLKICQSGEISPNLVTLVGSEVTIWIILQSSVERPKTNEKEAGPILEKICNYRCYDWRGTNCWIILFKSPNQIGVFSQRHLHLKFKFNFQAKFFVFWRTLKR